MASITEPPLSAEEIERIMSRSNGPYVLLELVRMGRVDSETAAKALKRFEKDPLWRRVALAMVDAVFSRG